MIKTFFQGVTLPVPPTIEPLESKLPDKVLQNLASTDFLKVNFKDLMIDFYYKYIMSLPIQKCLDKDPMKRWSCERLICHPYFEDYIQSQNKIDVPGMSRTKSKVFECI